MKNMTALISIDRTMINVLLKKEYPEQYTAAVSTRVSNALLVGEILGELIIGYVDGDSRNSEESSRTLCSLTCDYLGRKFAIVTTTVMIVVGGILATGK